MSKINDQTSDDANVEPGTSEMSSNPDLASSISQALDSGPEPIVVDPVG